VYITEEEYDAIKQELNDMLEGRSGNKGAQPSYQDTYMRLMQLEENREWSEQIDDAGGVTEEIINVGGHAQSSGALDPLIDENVYITEAEFETLLNELKEENNWSGGPIPGAETLINNRQLSEEAEEAQGHSYGTEEAAAIVFAEQEVPNTGNDYLERGAVIIRSIVPVIDQNGCIIMEERYVLGDTFIGHHDNVIAGLISTYFDLAPQLLFTGDTVSFVHTHPYCTGHVTNEFSGDEGDTVIDIIGEAIKRILNGRGLSGFGDYLGDAQVPWLPAVDRIYLASPTEQELYACDKYGPILDANGDYHVFGNYNAVVTNQLQE
jgi:hypothetical protein